MHIKEIAVKNLGPIGEFKCKPSLVNCIYGPNEAGKTFMVEFIIHSLFKEFNCWNDFRDLSTAIGRIRVEVFQGGKKVIREFFPEIPKKRRRRTIREGKIEKFFPVPNIHRVLIVKSGDVNIDSGHPLTKGLLLNFFSQNNFYTQISSKIAPTIKSAQIKDGIINISKQGEGRLYHLLKEDIEKLEKLIDELVSQYNPGQIKELEKEIERLEEEKELQIRAKRHKAYKLFNRIEKLRDELKKLPPQQDIAVLKEKLNQFQNLKLRLNEKERDLNELKKRADELSVLQKEFDLQKKARGYYAYHLSEKIRSLKNEIKLTYSEELLNNIEKNTEKWREKAQELEQKKKKAKELEREIEILNELSAIRETYTKFLENPPLKSPSVFILVFSLLLILISSFLPFTGITWAVLGVFPGLLGVVYFLFKYHKSSKDVLKSEEIKALKERFRELTGEELINISVLSHMIETLKEKKTLIENLEIERLETECELLFHKIKEDFNLLGYSLSDELRPELLHFSEIYEKLHHILNKIKQEKREKEEKLKELENLLARLDVDETEYIRESPGVEFDKTRYEELKIAVEELKKVKEEVFKLKEEVEKIKSEIAFVEKEIREWFLEFAKAEVDEKDWKKKLRELEENISLKIEEVRRLEGELKGLEIEKEEFLSEDPGVPYQKDYLNELENQIKELTTKKQKAEKDLQSLKAKVCQITGKDITTPWNELIKCLYQELEKKKSELKDTVARIVAGYLVHNVAEREKKHIENWVEEVLNSEEIKDIVEKITGKYKEFRLDEDEVLISDGFTNFSLRDLSTGAKEQVLIALRIGMAQKLFNSMPGFLILDDAFQHVDWKKREKLVDTLIDFAETASWQIFYFTMDDHIKHLFEKYLRKKPDIVKIWSLESSSKKEIIPCLKGFFG